MEWEESTEAGEQEGKGVALKSCTQFFQVGNWRGVLLSLLALHHFTIPPHHHYSPLSLVLTAPLFQWLKTAEPEDEPEEQQKVTVTIIVIIIVIVDRPLSQAVFSIGDGEAGGEDAPAAAPEAAASAAAPPAAAE